VPIINLMDQANFARSFNDRLGYVISDRCFQTCYSEQTGKNDPTCL